MTDFLVRHFVKQDLKSQKGRQQVGQLGGIAGIFLNLLLFAAKFTAGSLTGSIAITADAFNNLSDAGSSIVTLFAAMGFVSGIKMRTVVRRRPGRPIGSAY